MHVRFRNRGERLLVSLVEVRRIDGKVRNEHVASFGSVPDPPSVDDRIAFWQRLHERLAKLANRVDAATQGKLLGAIHARIPMVIVDEQRDVQVRNAEADEQFWQRLHDMHAATVADHQQLIATAQRAIANAQAAADNAAANAADAKDRAERIKRGEDVPGGLGKPLAEEDYERILRDAGMNTSDIRHCRQLAELHAIAGEAGMSMVVQASLEGSERASKSTTRRLLAALLALSGKDAAGP
jgi:hypothetical protein